jgi:hypothetical protein
LKIVASKEIEATSSEDPGSGVFFIPGSGIRDGEKPDLGSDMNIPENFSESLETVFWARNT